MKAICDVHISFKLVHFLNKLSVETIHANSLLKKWNTPDEEIALFADTNNLVVIAKDADFRNSFFLQKSPKRLIKIALGNISIFEKNIEKFKELYLSEESFYIEIAKENISVIIVNN